MGIIYDIEQDAFFKKGEKKGEAQGIETGSKTTKRVIAINLLRSGKLSLEEIAEVSELSLQEIKKIAQELDA